MRGIQAESRVRASRRITGHRFLKRFFFLFGSLVLSTGTVPSEAQGHGGEAPGKGHGGVWRFRPHHLFCTPFLPLENLARGEGFAETINLIRELVRNPEGVEFVLQEGPDRLCESCPDLKDGRCSNPAGDEEKVRKWDRKILEALDLSFGDTVSAVDWIRLVQERIPLEFCLTRCPWRHFCEVPRRSGS